MRRLFAAAGILAAVVLVVVISFGIWLYFYTGDLPSTAQLADFKLNASRQFIGRLLRHNSDSRWSVDSVGGSRFPKLRCDPPCFHPSGFDGE
jgi:hypothetical protein